MRVLLWHGWLLEGSGTNVFTARVAEALRAGGHDVALLCQEGHPERYPWIDAFGNVDAEGPSELTPNVRAEPSSGRCVLLRPSIGRTLPVFVIDAYEGFDVDRFLDLDDAALAAYLDRNVAALRAAAAWHRTETTFADHVVPGGPVAARALPRGSFVVKTAGSDVEYALRPQQRYRDLAAEGIRAARALIGPSRDVIDRAVELTGTRGATTRLVTPGVDTERFRPRERGDALRAAARSLDADDDTAHGRRSSLDDELTRALAERDPAALDALAHRYDQKVPDPDAATRLRALAGRDRPIVAYFGKLIEAKGPHLVIAAAALATTRPDVLVVGFGLWREHVAALASGLRSGDASALRWLQERGVVPREVDADALAVAGERMGDVSFTGRLDHRYAPEAIAAADVVVVPSILEEAFGMVVAEAAATGALPLVARHSGLAEVAAALEADVGAPGLFTFEPGPGATEAIAGGIDRLLSIDPVERRALGARLAGSVAERWSWEGTALALLT
ncbi:MAG TPA: glycosyltransferase [Actinomycetota bacterium]|nr:glycosyltransferase [Actinomycetota bacterium]